MRIELAKKCVVVDLVYEYYVSLACVDKSCMLHYRVATSLGELVL